MTNDTQQAWLCTVCGYIHRGPSAPEYCPICGASTAEFEPYEDAQPNSSSAPTPESWRCLDCGFIHNESNPPEYCPVCGAIKKRFEANQQIDDTTKAATSLNIVIIGGCIAGVSAAEAARETSPSSSVTLISAESILPYYRLNLTRYLADEIDLDVLPIHQEAWYAENNIDLIRNTSVSSISRTDHTITLSDDKVIPYDKLILTMGSHPFVPPFPGKELDGVHTVRTSTDVDNILAQAQNDINCICIGGGILGLEIAGALNNRGISVSLLESHAWLMPRQLNKDAAQILEGHINKLGINLLKNARTQEIQGNKNVQSVLLQGGKELPCEMVVIATGVRPNTHLARKAELDVDKGIIVDNHLTTSDPDILAAGDVAEHNGVVYGAWPASQFQGTIAGRNAVGIQTPFGGLPRSNALKVLGIDLFSIGQFEAIDGSYLSIDHSEGDTFYHFVFQDNHLCGAIAIGDAAIAPATKKAIESNTDFSKLLATQPSGKDVINLLNSLADSGVKH